MGNMSSEKLCRAAAYNRAAGAATSAITMQAANAISPAVKFRLFICCAPGFDLRRRENDRPSDHCNLGWWNCQMIIDHLDARYTFHGNSGCLLFIIRSDKSPQIDGAVADRHVEHRWPPQLRIQSGEHFVTDLRIAGACGGCVLCRPSGECLNHGSPAAPSPPSSLLPKP